MKKEFRLYIMTLTFKCCVMFDIISPPDLAGHYHSPLYIGKYGRQDWENLNLTKELMVVKSNEACSQPMDKFTDKVVLFHGAYGRSWGEDFLDVAYCLEQRGAVGMIFGYINDITPGYTYNLDELGNIQNRSNKFTLVIRNSDAERIINKVNKNSNTTVIVHFTADQSTWVEIWNSSGFFWYFQVILPVMNCIAIVTTLRASFLHYIRINSRSQKTERSDSSAVVLSGLMLTLVSSILRVFVLLTVPIFSSYRFSFLTQTMLHLITNSFEMCVTMLLAILFLRWGAFGEMSPTKQKRYEFFFIGIGILSVLVQIVISYLQALNSTGIELASAVGILLIFVFLVITTGVFIKYGIGLVKMISKVVGMASSSLVKRKQKYRKKAVIWIMIGASFQLFQILAYAMALNSEFFWSPLGFHVFFGTLYFGLTMNSLTNTQALSPPGYSLTTYFRKLLAHYFKVGTIKRPSVGAFFAEDIPSSEQNPRTTSPV